MAAVAPSRAPLAAWRSLAGSVGALLGLACASSAPRWVEREPDETSRGGERSEPSASAEAAPTDAGALPDAPDVSELAADASLAPVGDTSEIGALGPRCPARWDAAAPSCAPRRDPGVCVYPEATCRCGHRRASRPPRCSGVHVDALGDDGAGADDPTWICEPPPPPPCGPGPCDRPGAGCGSGCCGRQWTCSGGGWVPGPDLPCPP